MAIKLENYFLEEDGCNCSDRELEKDLRRELLHFHANSTNELARLNTEQRFCLTIESWMASIRHEQSFLIDWEDQEKADTVFIYYDELLSILRKHECPND